MNIPNIINAGDSATWTDDAFDLEGVSYTSAAYTLTYELRGASTLTLTATTSGTGWSTSITTTQSAALTPGVYAWAALLSKTGVRVTAGFGTLTVLPNIATQTAGYEARSTAQIALDAARAALADFTTNKRKIASYTIGDRAMTFENSAGILEIIRYWEQRVAIEGNAASVAAGAGNQRRLKIRFGG